MTSWNSIGATPIWNIIEEGQTHLGLIIQVVQQRLLASIAASLGATKLKSAAMGSNHVDAATASTSAIVSDSNHRALLWVDLSTGDRTALTPLGQQGFDPGQLFLDSANGRVLGYDGANSGSLFAVDIATGLRTVVSGHDIGAGPKGTGPLIGSAEGLDVATSHL